MLAENMSVKLQQAAEQMNRKEIDIILAELNKLRAENQTDIVKIKIEKLEQQLERFKKLLPEYLKDNHI
jgi:hypothetical protein